MKKAPRAMKGRLFAVAPVAPALAVVLFAAAGAFAQGVSAGRTGAASLAIEDLQVGEAGMRARVAIVCNGDCAATPRASGEFFMPGVVSSLSVDLRERTRFLQSIDVTPAAGGAILTVAAGAPVERVAIRRCAIEEHSATCLDFEFAPKAAGALAAAEKRNVEVAAAPSIKPEADASAARPPAQAGEVAVPASPGLRDAPEEARLIFASLAPPERLSPPKPSSTVVDPGIAATLAPEPVNIETIATKILMRSFGVAECGGAEARLRADAWALDAMVDVGFCKAIDGDLDGADAIFARLLEYTPDNYEALVGRAAIAARRGSRGDALEYFQEALNALPPIEESDRIVEAMAQI